MDAVKDISGVQPEDAEVNLKPKNGLTFDLNEFRNFDKNPAVVDHPDPDNNGNETEDENFNGNPESDQIMDNLSGTLILCYIVAPFHDGDESDVPISTARLIPAATVGTVYSANDGTGVCQFPSDCSIIPENGIFSECGNGECNAPPVVPQQLILCAPGFPGFHYGLQPWIAISPANKFNNVAPETLNYMPHVPAIVPGLTSVEPILAPMPTVSDYMLDYNEYGETMIQPNFQAASLSTYQAPVCLNGDFAPSFPSCELHTKVINGYSISTTCEFPFDLAEGENSDVPENLPESLELTPRQIKRRARKLDPTYAQNWCPFCRSNRETPEFYNGHGLRNEDQIVTCPILRQLVCPLCGCSGDNAHTIKYCPQTAWN